MGKEKKIIEFYVALALHHFSYAGWGKGEGGWEERYLLNKENEWGKELQYILVKLQLKLELTALLLAHLAPSPPSGVKKGESYSPLPLSCRNSQVRMGLAFLGIWCPSDELRPANCSVKKSQRKLSSSCLEEFCSLDKSVTLNGRAQMIDFSCNEIPYPLTLDLHTQLQVAL